MEKKYLTYDEVKNKTDSEKRIFKHIKNSIKNKDLLITKHGLKNLMKVIRSEMDERMMESPYIDGYKDGLKDGEEETYNKIKEQIANNQENIKKEYYDKGFKDGRKIGAIDGYDFAKMTLTNFLHSDNPLS